MKKLLLMLLLLGLVFSDIGPAPAKPSITLHFLLFGKEYTGPISVVYFCGNSTREESSANPVEQTMVNFTCHKGVCTNEDWFYKLNPCFYPKSGHFEIRMGDSDAIIRVDQKKPIDKGGSYEFTIDLNEQSIKEYKYCAFSSLLILATILLFVYRRY